MGMHDQQDFELHHYRCGSCAAASHPVHPFLFEFLFLSLSRQDRQGLLFWQTTISLPMLFVISHDK
jgi:hypothetical protein